MNDSQKKVCDNLTEQAQKLIPIFAEVYKAALENKFANAGEIYTMFGDLQGKIFELQKHIMFKDSEFSDFDAWEVSSEGQEQNTEEIKVETVLDNHRHNLAQRYNHDSATI